ncbi:hypothetical protein BVG19_g4998 [[Candida] boidinii]|nr:hypothetical protein BVG19_g4998 [[Candida] boidinii]OWB53570.1 hypothetical protein B5S27_g5173 [[Candida] boidinii]
MGDSLIGTPCKRCKVEPTVVESRNDNFCKQCFIRFIRGKQRKHMNDEKFRAKYGKDQVEIDSRTPRVLLSLSIGKSSLVLLDVVFSLLLEQSKMPRSHIGFKLTIAIIDDSDLFTLDSNDKLTPLKYIELIKQFYGDEFLNDLDINFKIINSNDFTLNSNDLQKKIKINKDYEAVTNDADNGIMSSNDLINQFNHLSTREDFSQIIVRELVLRTAVNLNCNVVLFGHSMTKLAVDVLALTVRGRGSEINSQLNDGIVKFCGTDIEIIHPLRDVLETEINSYCDQADLNKLLQSDESGDTQIKIKKSSKNKTISEMSKEYFQDVEITYPEVISTVVKIGSKLTTPQIDEESFNATQNDGTFRNCVVCYQPIYVNIKNWLEQITVLDSAPVVTEEEKENLQNYLNLPISNIVSIDSNSSHSVMESVCYGCLVDLGEKSGQPFTWPIRRPTKEEILKEFILTDEEDEDDEE